jgi:methyl-accepting chemotaxis protein/methyl-accepting chemotaxis protein-1 (serine sensor receptor)
MTPHAKMVAAHAISLGVIVVLAVLQGGWPATLLAALGVSAAATGLWTANRVTRRLRAGAVEMLQGIDKMANAAGQVAAANQSLAQGASEQAASLGETSATGARINSMARENAQRGEVATGLVRETDRTVAEANVSLEQMVSAMVEINMSSEKISKIIKVIDEIAFQTNILALNAAVEAARAGEMGLGFAVVADEVRNLAQRSAQAAKDTESLIAESIAGAQGGAEKVDRVTNTIGALEATAKKVGTLIDEVSTASQEQARGIEQILQAITQMEQVTQKTAANAEQSAAAGNELSSQMESLRRDLRGMAVTLG